jgi:hypothetical protein
MKKWILILFAVGFFFLDVSQWSQGLTKVPLRYLSDPNQQCGVWELAVKFVELQAHGFEIRPDPLFVRCLQTQDRTKALLKRLELWTHGGGGGPPRSLALLNAIVTSMWFIPSMWHMAQFLYAIYSNITAPILNEDDFAKVKEHLKKARVEDFKGMSCELQDALMQQMHTNPACKVGTLWHFMEGAVPGLQEVKQRDFLELKDLLNRQYASDKGKKGVIFTADSMRGKKCKYTSDEQLQKEFDTLPVGGKGCCMNLNDKVTYVSYPPSLKCAENLDRIRAGVAHPHFKGILGIKPELLRELKQFCLVKRAL